MNLDYENLIFDFMLGTGIIIILISDVKQWIRVIFSLMLYLFIFANYIRMGRIVENKDLKISDLIDELRQKTQKKTKKRK